MILDREEAKRRIAQKVADFDELVNSSKDRTLNEEDTKNSFILPLFNALGWRTDDLKEVGAEHKVSKGRVDYAFRIDGITKFYIEAKKPSEDVFDVKHAMQAVNYGWLTNVTWVVLTNFKELVIMNCEWKPDKQGVFSSRYRVFNYRDYVSKFDELFLLSKESQKNNELDRRAEQEGKRTKKLSVGEKLLTDFTVWRTILVKDIQKNNTSANYEDYQLDEIAQRILDRFIFIKTCEDKILENPALEPALKVWEERERGKLVKKVREIFDYYRQTYNSGLFGKSEEDLHECDKVELSDSMLSELIEKLYHPGDESLSYDFAAINADVLGNIYEQYLGHILRKTAKQVKVEEKHAHRKEQGIYYTPTYIVEYIVRNTLGELLKDKNVNPDKIRILDPACGSGSFLLKAFDVLNEHYAEKEKQTTLDENGVYDRKVKILTNNIYGVDLDEKAVEIAQLNLLLKSTEKKHRLPTLKQNIKCGNSLIDDETIEPKHYFLWEEQFKEILDSGRFDVVIGNPPYGAELRREEFEFFKRTYVSAEYKIDTYGVFLEKGLDLLKEGGYFGFIVPNTILTNAYFQKLRVKILNECKVIALINFGYYVFQDAKIDSLIIILKKESDMRQRESNNVVVAKIEKPVNSLSVFAKTNIPQKDFYKDMQKRFNVSIESNADIIPKIKKACGDTVLESMVNINLGFRVRGNEELIHSDKRVGDVPILHGRDIDRYNVSFQNRYFTYKKEDIVGGCSKREVYEAEEKLLIQAIRNLKLKRRIVCAYDNSQLFVIGGLLSVTKKLQNSNLKYLLALLNSKLLNFYFKTLSIDKNIKVMFLNQLPIKQPTTKEETEVVTIVDRLLSINRRLNELGDKRTDERAQIEEDIKKTDAEIDELVYKIYGINEEEKTIIEESLK